MIPEVRAERDRIRDLFILLEQQQNAVDMRVLTVFANHMAIRCAGFVEKAVQLTLLEYARRRANQQLASFVLSMVKRENSLNCEKIQAILDKFQLEWWLKIEAKLSPEAKEAVDSLKTIRDQLAHGNHNGTGLTTIKKYFSASELVIETMSNEIL